MAVSIDDIKRLRELTGVGMTDAKKALDESGGDFDAALKEMRKKGMTKAEKRGEREARQGLIGTYNHDGRIGVLVEVNCETDFVARNEDFQTLVRDLALHIAALSPQFVRREEIPVELLEREKEIERVKLREQKKPEAMIEKILTGKIEKYFETVCLVDQPFVKDDKKKVHEVVTEAVAKIGENISIRRFTRYQVGEGIEKKKEDLAAEVAKTIGQTGGGPGPSGAKP